MRRSVPARGDPAEPVEARFAGANAYHETGDDISGSGTPGMIPVEVVLVSPIPSTTLSAGFNFLGGNFRDYQFVGAGEG